MRVTVHRDTCIGSGRCTWLAPEVFGQDDDGFVVLLQERPGREHRDKVHDAQTSCPSRTIDVVED